MIFSLGLLNWKRKSNTIHIVNNMVKFNCINEILISNGNKKYSVKKTDFIKSNKIKIYNDFAINDIYGLDLRFINGLRSKNANIIIIDDDIKIEENELKKIIEEYKKNKNRIVGKWGRNIKNGYKFKDCYNNVDVVLTKLLICNKKLFNLFFICKPLIEHIYKTGVPYGNGEDIFLNFISSIYFNNKNFCLRVKTNKLPEMDFGVGTWKGHLNYRKRLCNYLIKNENKFIKFINCLKI